MLVGFHCIISAYGFWLPNEQRGSWSDFVRSWELFRFGPATKVDTHRSVARRPFDRERKRETQRALRYNPVLFTGEQARIIGMSMQRLPYPIYALAIMPDHTRIALVRIDRDIRRAIGHIKSEATRLLRSHSWFLEHPPWADHGWNVYLDSSEDVRRSIKYTNSNPTREGLRAQEWNCVQPYEP
jgi:REP element-mobilizing transposase RayT